ncbi:hypothetical protein cyc_08753 [Cyclospora cayetanensis]|uniref:Uncharacterized protein n=1 Tax=Cyclospora cayetanensis TaxID=88456 RepID=A0A1D3CZT1_9EIME|nr:hypothetical protein cyc_08753 [Cyclospora cayetanensis]
MTTADSKQQPAVAAATARQKDSQAEGSLQGISAAATHRYVPDAGVDRSILVDPQRQCDLQETEKRFAELLERRLEAWKSRCLPAVPLVLQEVCQNPSSVTGSCGVCVRLVDLSVLQSVKAPETEATDTPATGFTETCPAEAPTAERSNTLASEGAANSPRVVAEKRLAEDSQFQTLTADVSAAVSGATEEAGKAPASVAFPKDAALMDGCISFASCFNGAPSHTTLNFVKAAAFLAHVLGPLGGGTARLGGPQGASEIGSRSIGKQLPQPFLAMLLDGVTECADLIAGSASSANARKARSTLAAFLRLLELQGLATSQDICGIVSSSRLDEMQWSRLPAGVPSGGVRGARRVNELLVKERTKRKFTLTVHNAAREHIALYARMHALLIEFAAHPEKLPVEVAAHAFRAVVSNGNLCPSRSLSLLLGVYEDYLWAPNQLLPLVRLYANSKVREVVGFTLHLYADAYRQHRLQPAAMPQPQLPWGSGVGSSPSKRQDASTVRMVEEAMGALKTSVTCSTAMGPSKEFYDLLALLIMRGVLSLEELYPYLMPTDASLALLADCLAVRFREALALAKTGTLQSPPKCYASSAGTYASGNVGGVQHFGGSYGNSPLAWGGTPARGARNVATEEAAVSAALPPHVEHLLQGAEKTYRASRDCFFRLQLPKLELLASLLDFNAFESAEQLLLHFAGKLRLLVSGNSRVYKSLVRYISWLIHPILRGPEASLREMLEAAAKTQNLSARQSEGGRISGSVNDDPIDQPVPSGDALEALRKAAENESTFNPCRIPRLWLGVLLPSLRPSAEAASGTEAREEFRAQGLMQCHSFDDFFLKAVPLLRLLHASLAFSPRLLLGVLSICKEFAAAVKAGCEPRDWRYEEMKHIGRHVLTRSSGSSCCCLAA